MVAAAAAVQRAPCPKREESFWTYIARMQSKRSSLKGRLTEISFASPHRRSLLMSSRNYLLWEAWMTLAGARAKRGDGVLLDMLSGMPPEALRVVIQAWRDQRAGRRSVETVAYQILSTLRDTPVDLAILAAQGILASESDPGGPNAPEPVALADG